MIPHEELKQFLTSQGLPESYRLVFREDLLADFRDTIWLRARPLDTGLYDKVPRKLGLEVRVVGCTKKRSFVGAFVPLDEGDRDARMVSEWGVKFGRPYSVPRVILFPHFFPTLIPKGSLKDALWSGTISTHATLVEEYDADPSSYQEP